MRGDELQLVADGDADADSSMVEGEDSHGGNVAGTAGRNKNRLGPAKSAGGNT